MLSISPATKIFIIAGATDMRKQFDSLAAVVSGVLKMDPFSGQVFVFCNRKRNRLKILLFERSGFWVCAKRLEKGTFAWPDCCAATAEMTYEELVVLLGGLDLRGARRRSWYERPRATG